MTRKRIVISLLLGALTTLAVAWGSVLRRPLLYLDTTNHFDMRYRNGAAGEGVGRIELLSRQALGVTEYWAWALPPYSASNPDLPVTVEPDSAYRFNDEPSDWVRQRVLPWETGASPWPAKDFREMHFVDTRGWPWRCLWYKVEYTDNSIGRGSRVGLSVSSHMHGAIPFPIFMDRRSATIANDPIGFPFLPLWLALFADSFVWALTWLALLTGIPALHRLITSHFRRRRNLCPTCAYDLRATPPNKPCPECGTPRPNQSRAAQAPAESKGAP